MSETAPSGNSWQEQTTRLCRLQCGLRGEAFQPIPDVVDGDSGLEGVTSDGEGYQCYADQDSLNVAERVRKQKRKITADLGKLKTYKDFWTGIFGTRKLRRWFLVTPDVPDKAVVIHARRLAKKLREANLPFIDPAFEAFVVTDEHFQQAKDWLSGIGMRVMDFRPDEAKDGEVAKLPSSFVANTERKLRQVRPSDPDPEINAQRDRYLRWHLDCQNVLAKLLSEHPDLWERLQAFCSQQKKTVQFESSVDDSRPNQRLMNVRKSLSSDLDRDFKMLGKATLEAISLGSIAEWLGLCPLEFLQRGQNGN